MTTAKRPLTISTGIPASASAPRSLDLRSRNESPESDLSPLPESPESMTAPRDAEEPQTARVPSTMRRGASRRQSSISYLPSDSPLSWSVRSPPATATADKFSSSSKRMSLALDSTVSANTRAVKENRRRSMFVGPASAPAVKQAEPVLTLVEKHAPLLRFIAQKESKCLELRSELAVHEAELTALKQAWERIALGRASGKSPLSASALESLVDSMPADVAKLLDLSPAKPKKSEPNVSDTRIPLRSSPLTGVRSQHASSGSASTIDSHATDSSLRLSQSSESSFDSEHGYDCRPGEPWIRAPPTPDSPGRRLRDVPRRVLSGEQQRRSNAGLPPPPSGVPGLSSLAVMGLNSGVAAAAQDWVGKRLADSGKTLSKSQKRASVLLSDVSQTFLSAFSPTSPSLSESPSRQASPSLAGIDEKRPLSILDEDIPSGLGSVIPMTSTKSRPKHNTSSPTPLQTPGHINATDGDDYDDWNW